MIRRIVFFMLVTAINSFPAGQSGIITLVMPTGARSSAMGEVGTALADDEDVGYYNPAGLGMYNSRWHKIAATEFYGSLLPVLDIDGLWHNNNSIVYQPNYISTGGFAAYWNYISFGTDAWYADFGENNIDSYEEVFNFSWGFNFEEIGIKNHYFGISGKLAISALAPGYGSGDEYKASTIAFDVGYLWQCLPSLRIGLNIQNMGPSINYMSEGTKDPIPFTLNLGFAYKNDFSLNNIPFGQVCAEFRADREIVKTYTDKDPDPFWKAIYTGFLHDTSTTFQDQLDEINWHIGGEFTAFNTLSWREGYLFDAAGSRFEHHYGFGVKLFNHLQFDWANIYAPEGYLRLLFGHGGANGSRNGQWCMSFTLFNLSDWKNTDKKWWKIR
jgi:hypothetical protein